MCIPRSHKTPSANSTSLQGRKPQPATNNSEEQDISGCIFDSSKHEPRPIWSISTSKFIPRNIPESDSMVQSVPSERRSIARSASVKKYTKIDKEGKNRTVAVVQHHYTDYSGESEATFRNVNWKSRGGVAIPFPQKLHDMLEKALTDGYGSIVSWQPHGRSFIIHKPQEFQEVVLPKYYNLTKLSSFQRQLNLYGFQRLTLGRDRGCYYHELFLRNKKFLTRHIYRVQVKGTGVRARSNPDQEPNFWTMKWCESRVTAVTSDDDRKGNGYIGTVNFKRTREISTKGRGRSSSSSFSVPFPVLGETQQIKRERETPTQIYSMGFSPALPINSIVPIHQSSERHPCNFHDEDPVLSFGNHMFHYLDPFQPLSIDQNRNYIKSEVGKRDYAEIANLLSRIN